MRTFFAEPLAENGYRDDDQEPSRCLILLYDGASVTGLRKHSPRAAWESRGIAEVLLERAGRVLTGSDRHDSDAPA